MHGRRYGRPWTTADRATPASRDRGKMIQRGDGPPSRLRRMDSLLAGRACCMKSHVCRISQRLDPGRRPARLHAALHTDLNTTASLESK